MLIKREPNLFLQRLKICFLFISIFLTSGYEILNILKNGFEYFSLQSYQHDFGEIITNT